MNRTAFAGITAIISPFLLPLATANAQELALEEIVVTARKLEENLMEVPLAVTALFHPRQLGIHRYGGS